MGICVDLTPVPIWTVSSKQKHTVSYLLYINFDFFGYFSGAVWVESCHRFFFFFDRLLRTFPAAFHNGYTSLKSHHYCTSCLFLFLYFHLHLLLFVWLMLAILNGVIWHPNTVFLISLPWCLKKSIFTYMLTLIFLFLSCVNICSFKNYFILSLKATRGLRKVSQWLRAHTTFVEDPS